MLKIFTAHRNRELQLKSVDTIDQSIKIEKNKKYIGTSTTVNSIAKILQDTDITIESSSDIPTAYAGESLDTKKLLVIRSGGAGDIMFITPLLKYLKTKYTCIIGLASLPIYHSMVTNIGIVDNFTMNLMDYDDFKQYDYYIDFEGIIEDNPDAEKINAYDLMFIKAGIDPSVVKCKKPWISNTCKDYWSKLYNFSTPTNKLKIGYQLRASSGVRTVPTLKSIEILKALSVDYDVFIIDSNHNANNIDYFLDEHNLNVYNTAYHAKGFAEMVGLIANMDVFIGPDSSGIHIAGALGKPMIGLFAPFRSSLRMATYKNAVGIDIYLSRCGNGCFLHGRDLCNFAKEMGEDYAPCWKLLKPELILEELKSLIDYSGTK